MALVRLSLWGQVRANRRIYGVPSLLPRGPRPRAAGASRATARRRATVSRARRVRAPARRIPPPPGAPGGVGPRDVLGSLARAFLGQRGQHALGFARVRDYA